MPKKKFDPSAPHAKAAFDPSAQYDVEQDSTSNIQSVAEQLKGPTHRAALRNQQAQPNVSVAQRAADPTNQAITTGLKAAPYVAGAVAMGPELAASPVATLTKLATSVAGSKVGGATARYGAEKLSGDKDVQDLAEAGGELAGGVGGWKAGEIGSNLRMSPSRMSAPASETVKAPVSESEAAPPKLVDPAAPAASEGRPATWTNAKVVELAKQNNPDAIAQVKARKLDFAGSRYMTGEQMPSSPEYQSKGGITRFDAEGKPIVEGAEPSNAAASRSGPTYKTRIGRSVTEGVPSDIHSTMQQAGMPEGSHYMPGTDTVGATFNAPGGSSITFQHGEAVTPEALRAKMGGSSAKPTVRNKFSLQPSPGAAEASRLKLPSLTPYEQHLVEDIMGTKEYNGLSDAAKHQLLTNRILKLGGR